MKKILLTLVLISATFLAACNSNTGNSSSNNEDKTLKVYTTVYPLQFLAEEIGGDEVTVTSVYPAGSDEHTYEPSQKDLIDMAEADLFLYIGHNLEGFVTKAKPVLEAENVPVAAIGELIDIDIESHSEEDHDHDHSEEEAHDHGDVDPHVWLDPQLMIQMAEQTTLQLIELRPEKENYFHENYIKLKTKLETLDHEFEKTVEASNKKEIIVSHSAYGYWEARYGIEQLAVSGLSSTSEPSQKQLKELMETAKEHDINYVLFEQNIPSKLTETIQKEIGAKALTLHNLSVLTEEDINNKEDYFSLMEKNLEVLKTALQ
ncbi:MAG: metal ABC transporter solute-binding protein, Zn/Mn family [Bacillus sp. (in: firmicutes)]